MSYPPPGSCLVHPASNDAVLTKSLRGVLPASASLQPQPKPTYNNGSQAITFSPFPVFLFEHHGRHNRLGSNRHESLGVQLGEPTISNPEAQNQMQLPLNLAAPIAFGRPSGIIDVPRSSPLLLTFTPGDAAARPQPLFFIPIPRSIIRGRSPMPSPCGRNSVLLFRRTRWLTFPSRTVLSMALTPTCSLEPLD